jgi:hypothetical protein
MKRAATLLTLSIACHPATAKDQVSRPHITGIDHVRIYVSDPNKTNEFYTSTQKPCRHPYEAAHPQP